MYIFSTRHSNLWKWLMHAHKRVKNGPPTTAKWFTAPLLSDIRGVRIRSLWIPIYMFWPFFSHYLWKHHTPLGLWKRMTCKLWYSFRSHWICQIILKRTRQTERKYKFVFAKSFCRYKFESVSKIISVASTCQLAWDSRDMAQATIHFCYNIAEAAMKYVFHFGRLLWNKFFNFTINFQTQHKLISHNKWDVSEKVMRPLETGGSKRSRRHEHWQEVMCISNLCCPSYVHIYSEL